MPIVNLNIERSANFIAEVILTDYRNEYEDLSNVQSFYANVKTNYLSSNTICEFSTDIVDASNGIFLIELTANDTKLLNSYQTYVYDIFAVYDNDQIRKLFGGNIYVNGTA